MKGHCVALCDNRTLESWRKIILVSGPEEKERLLLRDKKTLCFLDNKEHYKRHPLDVDFSS